MKSAKTAAAMLCIFALGLFSIHGVSQCMLQAAAPSKIPVQPSATPARNGTLFPGLNEESVTAVTVAAPDRHFHFLCDEPNAVSVNGQQADSEAFLTLLEQIAEFPVDTRTAFSPDAQKLLLTLTVSSGTQQQIAHFYADGQAGEKAHIVVGKGDSSQYLMTGGWRVGALMMTCEGTRIQDVHGNETPAKQ